jgi:hypothetical protein
LSEFHFVGVFFHDSAAMLVHCLPLTPEAERFFQDLLLLVLVPIRTYFRVRFRWKMHIFCNSFLACDSPPNANSSQSISARPLGLASLDFFSSGIQVA